MASRNVKATYSGLNKRLAGLLYVAGVSVNDRPDVMVHAGGAKTVEVLTYGDRVEVAGKSFLVGRLDEVAEYLVEFFGGDLRLLRRALPGARVSEHPEEGTILLSRGGVELEIDRLGDEWILIDRKTGKELARVVGWPGLVWKALER